MTERACFVDLPQELQHIIGTYVAQHDLTCCVRVFQHWRTIFSPLIWRYVEVKHWKKTSSHHINITDPTWQDILRSIEAGALKTYYGQLISSFRLEFLYENNYFRLFLEHSPLTYPRLKSIEISNVDDDDRIAPLIERCPNNSNNSSSGELR